MKHGVLIDRTILEDTIMCLSKIKVLSKKIGESLKVPGMPTPIIETEPMIKIIEQAIESAPDAVIPLDRGNDWGNCLLGMKGYNQEMLCYRWGDLCHTVRADGRCPQITKE